RKIIPLRRFALTFHPNQKTLLLGTTNYPLINQSLANNQRHQYTNYLRDDVYLKPSEKVL
ncbi:hypothetical protein WP50_28220, partial [Lactiplantibacillus plantarum]